MKVGDLIELNVPEHIPGALTAVNFFGRLSKQTQGLKGMVVADHGSSVSALFGETVIVVNKKFIIVVDNRAKNC